MKDPRITGRYQLALTELYCDSATLWTRLDWTSVIFLLILPLYGMFQTVWVPLQLKTALWSFVLWFLTGIGITAGYHRLWAHTSYSARLPLRIFLALIGAAAFQRSIRWWARGHRAHHKFTDTNLDPYSIDKGFWYAHMGWMIFKPDPKSIARVQVADLDQDPVVIWQHKNFTLILVCTGILIPIAVPGLLWGDWNGGFVYAFILRMFTMHQVTFCVNSVAHTLGEQPFDRRNSPRDHFITALLTFGEGYHNFHHRFPCDYRNGVMFYHYDPTKWFIRSCKALGLAYDLKSFPSAMLDRNRKSATGQLTQFNGSAPGIALEDLPVLTWAEFVEEVAMREKDTLIVVSGVVHDVTSFIHEHPGGSSMIQAYRGKDVSTHFNGAIHQHSKEARDTLTSLRVAVLSIESH